MSNNTLRPLLLLMSLAWMAWPAWATQAADDPAPASASEPSTVQGVDVARDTLDSYAGSYVISPGFEARVWRDDQQLMLQVTGQDAWPLIAESEVAFLVPQMDARISFGLDARGTVDHLVVYVDGQETRAMRR